MKSPLHPRLWWKWKKRHDSVLYTWSTLFRVGWIDSVAVYYAADRRVMYLRLISKQCWSRKWRLLSNSPTELKMQMHVDRYLAPVCSCVHGMHSYFSVNIIIMCCAGRSPQLHSACKTHFHSPTMHTHRWLEFLILQLQYIDELSLINVCWLQLLIM